VSAVATEPRLALGRVAVRVAVAPLTMLVAVNAIVRTLAAWLRLTPSYFPDEYMYSQFSRSFAAGQLPSVRGAHAHFLPLLEPLLTAPAWLLPGVELGFRGSQTINAFAMSLAAVPVYLLARRVGLSGRLALVAAAMSLTLPAFLYSSFIMSEPVAYPIALGAVAAAVHALDRPSARSYSLFVALTALAMFARMQFAVLIPCFVLALMIVVIRGGRVREFVRSHRIHIALLLLVSAALFAIGPARNTGYYPSFTFIPNFGLSTATRILAADVLVLVFACGFVIAPGALLGVVLGIVRPRGRTDLSFAAMTLLMTVALFAQAVVYGNIGYVQERYLFYLLPLWTIAFLRYAQRGWPWRSAHALIGFTLVVAALVLPLEEYTVGDAWGDSPFLFALKRLGEVLGGGATAALVSVLAALAATTVVVVVSFLKPRAAMPVAVAIALAATAAASVGAASFDIRNAGTIHRQVLGGHPTWIDDAHLGSTSMFVLPGSRSIDAVLFWNRSIDRLVLYPGIAKPDSFALVAARFSKDGTVLVDGRPLRGPVVVADHGSTFRLQGGTILKRSTQQVLVRPHGSLRLGLMVFGRYSDGWLDEGGYVVVWPKAENAGVSGRLVLPVRPPRTSTSGVTLRFVTGRFTSVERHASAGRTTNIVVPLCSNGPIVVEYSAGPVGSIGDGRRVVAMTGMPRFVPARGACK
jgi:hypothetical protein